MLLKRHKSKDWGSLDRFFVILSVLLSHALKPKFAVGNTDSSLFTLMSYTSLYDVAVDPDSRIFSSIHGRPVHRCGDPICDPEQIWVPNQIFHICARVPPVPITVQRIEFTSTKNNTAKSTLGTGTVQQTTEIEFTSTKNGTHTAEEQRPHNVQPRVSPEEKTRLEPDEKWRKFVQKKRRRRRKGKRGGDFSTYARGKTTKRHKYNRAPAW